MTYEEFKKEIEHQLQIVKFLEPLKIRDAYLSSSRKELDGRYLSQVEIENLFGFVTNDVISQMVDGGALPDFMIMWGKHKYLFAKGVNRCIEKGLITEDNIKQQIIKKQPPIFAFMMYEEYIDALNSITTLEYREKIDILDFYNKMRNLFKETRDEDYTLSDFIINLALADRWDELEEEFDSLNTSGG